MCSPQLADTVAGLRWCPLRAGVVRLPDFGTQEVTRTGAAITSSRNHRLPWSAAPAPRRRGVAESVRRHPADQTSGRGGRATSVPDRAADRARSRSYAATSAEPSRSRWRARSTGPSQADNAGSIPHGPLLRAPKPPTCWRSHSAGSVRGLGSHVGGPACMAIRPRPPDAVDQTVSRLARAGDRVRSADLALVAIRLAASTRACGRRLWRRPRPR